MNRHRAKKLATDIANSLFSYEQDTNFNFLRLERQNSIRTQFGWSKDLVIQLIEFHIKEIEDPK